MVLTMEENVTMEDDLVEITTILFFFFFFSLDQSNRFSTEDTSSAFYLSNSEHPGLSLVSTQLIGSNYNSWNRVMCIALIAKKKIGFVNGSIARLEDDGHVLFSIFGEFFGI